VNRTRISRTIAAAPEIGSDPGVATRRTGVQHRSREAARRGVCVVTAEARNAAEADRAQEIMGALRPIDLTMPVI